MADESQTQRVNRELIELLNELRVALPGVQVLFAFLLTVPFQQRFGAATGFERNVYFVTLCATGVALALLITPSALHRLNFRSHNKLRIVLRSNELALLGLGALAVSLTGVMLLIGELLFGAAAGAIAGVVTLVALACLWLALPLRERRMRLLGDDERLD